MQNQTNQNVRIPAIIERMRFQNEGETWGVAMGSRLDRMEAITMVGSVCGMIGKPQTFVGKWKKDEKFGMQLEVSHIAIAESLDNEAVARILTIAYEFRGVGPKTAERLVVGASEQGLAHDLVNDIEGLANRSGVKVALLVSVQETWNTLVHGSEEVLFLTAYGLTQKQIAAMQKRYGKQIIQRVQADPYILVRGFRSLTFRRVDEVATKQGTQAKDPRRVRACIVESFHQLQQDGHTVATPEMFKDKCMALIGTVMNSGPERELIARTMKELQDSGILTGLRTGEFKNDTVVGLTKILAFEQWIMMLAGESYLAATIDKPELVDIDAELGLSMDECESILGHRPTEEQYAAGRVAATYPIMFLVGGAGVGKTFTIRLIGEVFSRMGFDVTQAAPTGKAAKRMFQSTEVESNTIHRTLNLHPKDSEKEQSVDIESGGKLPLATAIPIMADRTKDAFIIDEASMLDSYLSGVVAKHLCGHSRGVFVFDDAQLPPVGAGSPILDLKEMGVVPTVTLSLTHRNSGRLYEGIQGVRHGGIFASPLAEDEFLVTNTNDPQFIVRESMDFYEDHMHTDYGNAQILCPMKMGDSGVKALNAACQWKRQLLNGQPELQVWPPAEKETLFVGDKVLCVKNLYEGEKEDRTMKVQNGSLGVLEAIELNDKGDRILSYSVHFDGDANWTELTGIDETSKLTLGYAITVHKSQGSEWPFVLYAHPMGGAPGFLDRRMLYTGVSRAQTQTLCYGPLRGMQKAAALAKGSVRMTSVVPHIFQQTVASMQSARLAKLIESEMQPPIPTDTMLEETPF